MLLAPDKTIAASAENDQYEIEVVDSLAELRALEPEWRQFLARGVTGDNFFNDPLYLLSRIELEPQLKPRIVVLRDNGRICSIAPFVLHNTHLKIEFSVIKLASFSVRMLKALGGQFVLAADVDVSCWFQQIFDCLWSRQSEFDLIYLENLPVPMPLWEYYCTISNRNLGFHSFLASSKVDVVHRIQFPQTHGEFLSSISYETRRKLRRYCRRLQNKERIRLERIHSPSQVPYFLEHLDHIYRETWQAKVNGFFSRNNLSYTQYFTKLSQAGYLRSYFLVINDTPVAFAIGHQYNGVYYFLETGYAQAWADFGPGIVLMHLFFEDLLHDNKPALLDFIGGNQRYKQSFSNSQHGVASVYIAMPNRWRHLLRIQQLLHFLSRQATRAVVALKLDSAARRLLSIHH